METSPSDVGFMEAGITLPLISDANSFGTLDGLMGQTASGELSVRMDELSLAVEEEKQRFKQAVEKYQALTAGSKYYTSLDLNEFHTWEEVLQSVNDASERYNDVSGYWGKIRKGFRRFGQNNQVFQAWAELLPSQSQYFSILCGGLKLIFGAATRLHDLRTEVSEALAELPTLLGTTRTAMGIFRASNELQQCSVELYIATLAALQHIVNWYTEKATKKITKSLFKQDSYQRELSEKLKAIRAASTRFAELAQLCSYREIATTRLEIQEHQRLSKNAYELILQGFEEAKTHSLKQNQVLGHLGNKFINETEATQQMMRIMALRVMELEATVTRFVEKAPSTQRRAEQGHASEISPNFRLNMENISTGKKAALVQFLEKFGFNSTVFDRDLWANLKSLESLSKLASDRLAVILRSPKFQDWMASPVSEVLFINCASHGSVQDNSAAFLCAHFVHAVQTSFAKSGALSFFCKEHSKDTDPYYGAAGLLKSLLGQLLLRFPDLDYSHMKKRAWKKVIDVDSLYDATESLLSQLAPEVVLFCAIDGINLYEEHESVYDEVEELIEFLVDLSQRPDGCAFKLIMTCSWNSHKLYKLMPSQDQNVLWIPSNVTSQVRLTSTSWRTFLETNFHFLR